MADRLTAASAVSLRDVRDDDRDFILALFGTTRAAELELTGWSDADKAAFVAQQFAAQDAQYQAYPGRRFSVVLLDDRPIGRLYVSQRGDEIRIVDIIVAAEHRGRGIGTVLLRRLIAESEASRRSLTIHVERENPAYHWYGRLGFEIAGDIGTHYFMRRAPRAPR